MLAQGTATASVIQAGGQTSLPSATGGDATSKASGALRAVAAASGLEATSPTKVSPPTPTSASTGDSNKPAADASKPGNPALQATITKSTSKRKAPADDDGEYTLPERADAESEEEHSEEESGEEHGVQAADVAGRAQFLLLGLKIELDRYVR